MKFITKQEAIGEYLGPVDWSYDFTQYNWGIGKSGTNPDHAKAAMEWLRAMRENPSDYLATTDGGWPRVGWKRVLCVGMWDGWPFWKPTPSVFLDGPLGGEWHPWYSISEIEKDLSADSLRAESEEVKGG